MQYRVQGAGAFNTLPGQDAMLQGGRGEWSKHIAPADVESEHLELREGVAPADVESEHLESREGVAPAYVASEHFELSNGVGGKYQVGVCRAHCQNDDVLQSAHVLEHREQHVRETAASCAFQKLHLHAREQLDPLNDGRCASGSGDCVQVTTSGCVVANAELIGKVTSGAKRSGRIALEETESATGKRRHIGERDRFKALANFDNREHHAWPKRRRLSDITFVPGAESCVGPLARIPADTPDATHQCMGQRSAVVELNLSTEHVGRVVVNSSLGAWGGRFKRSLLQPRRVVRRGGDFAAASSVVQSRFRMGRLAD